MAVYTTLTNEQIAHFLARAYDLGTLEFALGITQGVENTNYLVSLRNADGVETHYIFTIYEKRVHVADLPFFLHLLQHVAAHPVACPRPLVRRDGALFGAIEGKQASLVSFVQGKSRTIFTPEHTQSVGEALGQLHQATQGFALRRENTLNLAGWQQLYAKIAEGVDGIQPGLSALIAAELAWLRAQMGQFNALPSGVIHADLFPDNVFFDGDHVSGIIDFYFACNDWLAYDLAITINAWCFEADATFNADKCRRLVAGYQRQRSLTVEEQRALPVLLRGAALRFLLTRAHDWLHRDPNALVKPHDPLDYVAILQFHQDKKDTQFYDVRT